MLPSHSRPARSCPTVCRRPSREGKARRRRCDRLRRPLEPAARSEDVLPCSLRSASCSARNRHAEAHSGEFTCTRRTLETFGLCCKFSGLLNSQTLKRIYGKRVTGGQGRNRTTDTRIFSPLLYQLSYLASDALQHLPTASAESYRIRRPSPGRVFEPTRGWPTTPGADRLEATHQLS